MNAIIRTCVLLLFLGNTTYAQWTSDPTINTPVCTTLGTHQMMPQIVADGSGGAIVTWMEAAADMTSSRIYAQHLSATGTRLWPGGGIDIVGASGLFTNPQIVTDGQGGAIISWINTAGGQVRHYMQKVSANAQLQWTPGGVLVCPATVTPYLFYQLVSDNNGGATLVWDDVRITNVQVFAQRIAANGQLQWAANGLACTPGFAGVNSFDAVADSSGGIVFCYIQQTNLLYRNEVYLQQVTPNGSPGFTKILSNAYSDQLYCKIARDSNDHMIVAWQDFRHDPNYSQLFAQSLDSVGNELWQPGGIMLVDSVVPMSTVIKIVSDTKRGAVVTWLDDFITGQSTTAHLHGIRVDRSGTIVWDKKEIATWTEAQPSDYKLVSDYQGGAYVSFHKGIVTGTPANDHYDIGAQHISGNGALAHALTGTPVSAVPMYQYYQQLMSDSSGVVIATWSDLRNMTDWDVYAQRLGGPVSLPVTWMSFSGRLVGSSVLLEWQTATEVNNEGFVMQRSGNGVKFDSIGFVGAQVGLYKFTDAHPLPGVNIYRLLQKDYGGAVSYSKLVTVVVGDMVLRVYPNPASEYIRVTGNGVIYSAAGQRVKQFKAVTQVAISDLPPGVYYVSMGGQWASFIKQ